MSKNTSILLGDHFEKFIHQKIASGRYNNTSEVIRNALRLMELEELKLKSLIDALEEGENSKMLEGISSKNFLSDMHKKHLK